MQKMQGISEIPSKLSIFQKQMRANDLEDTSRSPEQDIYRSGSNVNQRGIEIISWTKFFSVQKCWQQAYMNESPIDKDCKGDKGAWKYTDVIGAHTIILIGLDMSMYAASVQFNIPSWSWGDET